ncbi:MAG: polysaccharide deacetylase family protein [Actinomycetota bacterium]|nr:polysaccharide deacetylase family protein [Actinomycetota bacterium]
MNRLVGTAAAAAGLGAAAQWVPSVVSLGQWSPLRALPGRTCRWRGTGNRVALTFDDGPSPAATPAVLDALDRLDLRATFFCLGTHAARWPGLVDEIVQRGHAVGTHGHSHGHHLGRSPRWVLRDLDDALVTMAGLGVRPRWYRPPYGQVSGATMAAARFRRVELVLWSAWGREWTAPPATTVARRVTAALAPGAIVLLHDSDACSTVGTSSKALAALWPIAEELDRRSLRAVTLDELVPR